MRLTLRTLLAYQDDMLEPADAEQLAAKIQESETASQLVQRTQGVMRQLRLSAPKTLGKGMGLDPNTVAEYLDNTLPAERVADFERVCLESDVHLAEVAACHQILALILGEPAEVDPEARRAMYTLPTRLASHARAESVRQGRWGRGGRARRGRASAAGLARAPPQVPDYLREPDRWPRLVPVAAVALLLLLLGAAIFMAADPMNWRGPIAEQPQGEAADADQADQATAQPEAAPATTPSAETDDEATAVAKPTDTAPLTVPEDAVRPAQPPADATVQNQEPPVPTPADTVPADAAAPVATATAVPTPPDAATAPPPTDAAPPAQRVEAVGGLGRLITTNSVLLKHDPSLNGWVRVPGGELVVAGDRLLSLPTFRSTLTLNTGVTLDLVGPTLVELHPVDDQNVPSITLHYGRLTLLNLGQPNTKARLRVLNREGLVTFTDAESSIAAEVQHILPPGQNPETTPALKVADMYALSGQSTWQELPAAEVRKIQAPAHWTLSGGPPADPAAKVAVPPWISLDDTQPIDRRASQHVADYVKLGEDVRKSLTEISVHRLKENRRLAARCLAQIDEFEPAVDALNDREQAVFASWLLRSLRSAMARDPQTAERVRLAFEKRRGDSGVALFRMLWGYTTDQLRDGAAGMLVEYLDHSELDFRVLSFSNLQEIVGATARYRPEANATERKPLVQAWQRKLEAGEIVPKPAG